MTIQTFIEKAIEGGWKPEGFDASDPVKVTVADDSDGDYGIWDAEYPDEGSFASLENYAAKAMFLDPAAWKAVGKVEGWEDGSTIPELEKEVAHWKQSAKNAKGEYDYWGSVGAQEKAEKEIERIKKAKPYQFYMHRMIDALAEGKTIEQYIETI